MSWSSAQKVRLATEKEYLDKMFPNITKWKDPTSADQTKVLIDQTTNSGKCYTLRIDLPNDYPSSCPTLFIKSPTPLKLKDEQPIPENSLDFHTLRRQNGYIQICYFHPLLWDESNQLYQVALKGRMWLEAYEGYLDTGKPIDTFLSSGYASYNRTRDGVRVTNYTLSTPCHMLPKEVFKLLEDDLHEDVKRLTMVLETAGEIGPIKQTFFNKILDMVYYWEKRNGVNATLAKLLEALQECKRGDLVLKIKQILDLKHFNEEKETPILEIPELPKWEKRSVIHREKLGKLLEYGQQNPKEIKQINGVRVCCSQDFLIGKGSDGTRVYVGLGNDGYERAVKRLHKDACACKAEQEKKVLNELNATESNYVVKYCSFDNQCDRDYIFLILDLCEETLADFVARTKLEELATTAPEIIEQILKGLADLHRDPTPILHRDLKPSNIFRNVHGKWLLADFGISRIMKKDETTIQSTSQKGTKHWKAVESFEATSKDGKVRYKKESDIQVAGMVAYYIVTKGRHPFGEEPYLLINLHEGKPVGLDKLEDHELKDLLTWMLSHDAKDRPSAEEALKHPYFQTKEVKFEMLCKIGNERQIKRADINSNVVQQLNSDTTDWKTKMKENILKYLSMHFVNEKPKTFCYDSSWTDCLRLMRNVNQHWKDRPRPQPQPEAFYQVGDPQEYFLNVFPNLPVVVHRIIRSSDWRERPELQRYFK